jgi:hypothetical protein
MMKEIHLLLDYRFWFQYGKIMVMRLKEEVGVPFLEILFLN